MRYIDQCLQLDGSVAVTGLGAVGMCALRSALTLGAATVYAVDSVQTRRDRGQAAGAVPVSPPAAQTIRLTTALVQQTWPELVPLLQSGRLDVDKIITTTMPLDDATAGYDAAMSRAGGSPEGAVGALAERPLEVPGQ